MQKIGRYKILGELGRGAMGVVYHATDPTIGRAVAIKILRLRDIDQPEQRARLRERLFREARSAGALSHPGIVTIYDMDESDGTAFIAMEYVAGKTLEQILREPGALAAAQFFAVLHQTAAALDYAHRKGIIHRDIKPANIMIDQSGAVKITDFGIAKISEFEGQTITGAMLGTPNYMSPEQVQGLEIDGRSDQFSLAVVAYEILAGRRPFSGEQLSTVVYKIVAEAAPAATDFNKTLGEKVDGVLKTGLAKKPERRYRTCAAFASAVEAACMETKSWRLPGPPRARRKKVEVSNEAVTMAIPRAPAATQKRSFAGPFLLAFLLFIAILAAVAWQTGVFQSPTPRAINVESPPTPPAIDDRPSALHTSAKEVWVTTSPAGAVATLDNQSDGSCKTPCKFLAEAGRHTVSVKLEGYAPETREVTVGQKAVEIPAIALTSTVGILQLDSDPAGADIFVDGKATNQFTPATLSLPAGTHEIRVQKNGAEKAVPVEMHTGEMQKLQISVGN